METRKAGWYIFFFGIFVIVIEYFGILNYLAGKPAQHLIFTQWMLTPIAWSVVALIIVGLLMVKFGRKNPIPYYR